MDDLELPSLPQESTSRPSYPLLTRKRTREDYYNEDAPMSAASSDPALFSGDENVPGAEDYSIKRKKKVYSGSWFNHRMKAKREDKQREFKRNYDSGIFMGSEGSEPPSSDSIGSLEEEFMHDQRKTVFDLPTTPTIPASKSQPLLRSSRLPFRYDQADVPPQHGAVNYIVQLCLEKGQESVDLSSLSLTDLPPAITSLSTLTKQTSLVSGMLDHGENFEAELRLFLGTNLLRRLPPEVLDLTNLRLLSLRSNKLTSLPPGIRTLTNLDTLNVAGNKLTSLPFEVIELVRFHHLRTITAGLNSWLPRPEPEPAGTLTRWLRSATKPLLYRWDGQGHAQTTFVIKNSTSRTPSLTEMSLRSLARSGPHHDLSGYMPPDTPASIFTALETLHEADVAGGYQCSRCGCTIVQAGHRHIEWWAIGPEDGLDGSMEEQAPVEEKFWSPFQVELRQVLPFERMYCRQDCEGTRNGWCDEYLRTRI